MSDVFNSSPNTPIKKVFVLGNGQLARMLKQSAEPLGITVKAMGLDTETSLDTVKNEITEDTVITAEIERWPTTPITDFLASQSSFVNRHVFAQLADRYTQKKLIDSLNLNTASWVLLPEKNQWHGLFDTLCDKVVVKTRTGGYDGRGQWRVTQTDIDTLLPIDLVGEAIVESMIPFDYEVSLVGARSYQGDKVFYPLTHNFHQDGILRASIAYANSEKTDSSNLFKNNVSRLQTTAESMLGKLLDALNYVGVLAMECFVVNSDNGPTLLINELAPRVHNSGHWTQNGASISQFELHIRAICGLPLVKPTIYTDSVMVNIIGTELNYDWMRHTLVNLHWYDKAPREGRKLGHLNIMTSSKYAMEEALDSLVPNLPKDYLNPIEWIKKAL